MTVSALGKGRYDDIINLPHHVSPTRAKMSMRDRAGQFAPFAALTGYGEKIDETARRTDGRRLLEEDAREELDRRLGLLAAEAENGPEIRITYFIRDEKKAGGRYEETRGRIKRIDTAGGTLTLSTGETLRLADISALDGELFDRHGEK